MKKYLKDLTPEEVIRRLKAGEMVKDDRCDVVVKMIDDIISSVFSDGSIRLNVTLDLFDDDSYFETPDELKLEVGKCYKTRDGRKAFVCFFMYGVNRYKGVIVGESFCKSGYEWDEKGLLRNYMLSEVDLISEWSDDDA